MRAAIGIVEQNGNDVVQLSLSRKLAILSDAAKYDASCASSGTVKRDSSRTGGIGSTEGSGICHSYAPDGRCISLLKVLLTNFCVYDCIYCVNRSSSNVQRARFSVEEVVKLTLDFYKRNYIEGLFLSSGIIRSPDYTMEEMVRVARTLRETHRFGGYIHLKVIPNAAPELLAEAGAVGRPAVDQYRAADGCEPRSAGAREEAERHPDRHGAYRGQARGKPARREGGGQEEADEAGAGRAIDADDHRGRSGGRRGDPRRSASLYSGYGLKRVYYSAFSPIPDASSRLPLAPPPLLREHRLYQADWLMRFYGFGVEEIVSGGTDGLLDLKVDPKLAWALGNRGTVPDGREPGDAGDAAAGAGAGGAGGGPDHSRRGGITG